MRVLTMLALTVIMLSSCSKHEDKAQTEKKAEPKTPEQVVDEFIDGGEFHYEMLSASERQEVTQQEWDDEINFSEIYPEAKLTPASKYYELEQFLIDSIGYTTEVKSAGESPVKIDVTFKQPRLYLELPSFSKSDLISEKEPFDNALAVFKKGILTKEKMSFQEGTLTWEIEDSGVVVGAKDILERHRKQKQRSEKFKSLRSRQKEIDSEFNDFYGGDFILGDRDSVKKLQLLRALGIERAQNLFSEYKELAAEICLLYREESTEFSCDFYEVENLHEVTEIIKADNIINSTIKVNSSSVEKIRDNYGVFYEWEVSHLPANVEKYSLIMEASLLKGGEKVDVAYVGSLELSPGVKKREEGRRLDDGASLQRPDGVEINYAGISGLVQSDCELVNDEIKCKVGP